jgi:hypothetical protein
MAIKHHVVRRWFGSSFVCVLLVFGGCRSFKDDSGVGVVSVATAQAFHADICGVIHGGELDVECSVEGFSKIARDGAIALNPDRSLKVLPLRWRFVRAPSVTEMGSGFVRYPHLLTVTLVPQRRVTSDKFLLRWQDYDVEIMGPNVDLDSGLDSLRDRLILVLKTRLPLVRGKMWDRGRSSFVLPPKLR